MHRLGAMFGALAFMVSVTGAAAGPVGAVEERTIEGTVLDGWGNPVAGVVVFDREDPEYQAYGYTSPLAETDAAGHYAFTVAAPWARLQYSVPGTYRLRYEHPRMESVNRDVDVVAESETVDVDATYLHQAEGPGGPVSVGSSDDIVEVELRSSAPAPGAPGEAGRSCAWVEADGAAPVAATFEAVEGTVARFDWSHVVAQGTPDGTYAFTTWTADCADPDRRLSAVDTGAYQVLTRPMAVVETAPSGMTGPSWVELAFRTSHAMVGSTVVLDGIVRTERAPSSAWEVRVPLMNLADGTHKATVSGVDRNGEVTPARTFTWTVDGTGPVLSGGSPRGTIAKPRAGRHRVGPRRPRRPRPVRRRAATHDPAGRHPVLRVHPRRRRPVPIGSLALPGRRQVPGGRLLPRPAREPIDADVDVRGARALLPPAVVASPA